MTKNNEVYTEVSSQTVYLFYNKKERWSVRLEDLSINRVCWVGLLNNKALDQIQ